MGSRRDSSQRFGDLRACFSRQVPETRVRLLMADFVPAALHRRSYVVPPSAASTRRFTSAFGMYPTIRATNMPFLKSPSVGMLRIL